MTTLAKTSRLANNNTVAAKELSKPAAVKTVKEAVAVKEVALAQVAPSAAGLARTLGVSAPEVRRAPQTLREAFDALPCSGSGPALVRRFTQDNPGAWNMVLDLARSPEKSMKFSYFAITKDPYGHAFLGAALFNQMRGIDVTGMMDWSANARGKGFVSYFAGIDYLQELANFGAKVGVYNTPMKRVESLLTEGPSVSQIVCNHDKIFVIDEDTPNAQGTTGGRNVAGEYYRTTSDMTAEASSWSDDSLHLKGEHACGGLTAAADREMESRATKMISPSMFNKGAKTREMLFSYALMEQWVSQPALSEASKKSLRGDERGREQLGDQLLKDAGERLNQMIATLPADVQAQIPKVLTDAETANIGKMVGELVSDLDLCGSRHAYAKYDGWEAGEVKIIDQTSMASVKRGNQRYNEISEALVSLFNQAKEEILIKNPYVVLTETMLQTLEAAAKRGVKISILTNSPESTDSALTVGCLLNTWPMVLARVPTMKIMVSTDNAGVDDKATVANQKLHAKTVVIDGKIAVDATKNADLMSVLNSEVAAITWSEASAKNLSDSIKADIADPAKHVVEWTIQKDANGAAVLNADRQPVVTYGPEKDVSKKTMMMYKPMQLLCKGLPLLSAGEPLRHPEIGQVLASRDW